ncbi:alpha-amylase [Olea europaea subsp. europaea]|uniref:Alpha-amylase n=1 Tax=Olea europaea subsp. europaea TaxID=158383 RepID=A0A8S0UYW1_OLEEU|nr:alpha-amylase [Olea europaea subsp. europaea]
MENTSPDFAVGELWNPLSNRQDGKLDCNQDGHRNELMQWVHNVGGRVIAFDFTTKGILQAAVQGELWRLKDPNGKPPGMIGIPSVVSSTSTSFSKLNFYLSSKRSLL